ncbi:MAG: hypothetical protein AAF495_26185 [Pseudomonadota bacterium]
MAKYAPLKFLREDQVPRHPTDLLFRQRRWTKIVALALFAGVTGGFLLCPTICPLLGVQEPIPALPSYIAGGFLTIFVLIAWHAARASFRASSWRVRATTNGLYVKVRSFLNHGLSAEDAVVVYLPKAEIVGVREHRIWARRPGTDDSETIQRLVFLEIVLHDEDLGELVELLKRERAIEPGKKSGVSMISRHYPVRVLPGGIVQVDWSGLSPGLKRAVTLLSGVYPLLDGQKTRQQRFTELDKTAQEDRLLELVERGETVSAIKLAKELYGYDTTDAKAFVDDLARR